MAITGIAVALIAVLLSITYAAKLTDVGSQSLAKKESPASRVSHIEAISKVPKAGEAVKIKQGNHKSLKRYSDLFAFQQECTDDHVYCEDWASTGECFANPNYMHTNCRYSCGICCANNNDLCQFWAATGECYINPDYMLVNCRLSCGECCADNNDLCPYWAATGECFEQLDFMMENCAMSCGQCPGYYLNFKRDVTRDLGNSPPGSRKNSPKHPVTDDKMKRAKEHLAKSHSGDPAPPGTRPTGSQ